MRKETEKKSNVQQLYADTKEYLNLQIDYLRLQSVEKLTKVISAVVLVFVSIILFTGLLFYLFFTLAYVLEPVLGSLALSLGVITIFYLILLVLFYIFREVLIVNPLLKIFLNILYDKSEEKEKDEN